MLKFKTKKSAAKRFRITGSGKIVRKKAYKRHILESKSPKKKRVLSKKVIISKSEKQRVRTMIPGIRI